MQISTVEIQDAVSSILDATDLVAVACDLLEVIRMAHSAPEDQEDKAVSTTAFIALKNLQDAKELLSAAVREARGTTIQVERHQ